MRIIFLVSIIGWLYSCSSYKQSIMFNTSKEFIPDTLTQEAERVMQGYLIQPHDQLQIEIFTNKGEQIIDPYPELSGDRTAQSRAPVTYVVSGTGWVKLPLMGTLMLSGITLHQAEEKIQEAYQEFFKEPYAVVRFTDKRVVLLGALEGMGQVIPLKHQNMKLTEVLALGKGISKNAKAQSIKVLRGERIFIIDFSSIKGYQSNNIVVYPGDIIYVEPIRRPVSEAFKDYGGLVSVVVSIISLITVIISFNK